MLNRTLIALTALLVALGVGYYAFAWFPRLSPITPPAVASFAPTLVAQGQILAAAGSCATCHTAKGGKPYAGGLAIVTGFGSIYSSNITPDAKTGIGTWTLASFSRALHQGVDQDGEHLYPVFPYDHFTKLTDDDTAALYAFMMTRQAVESVPPANALPFPLNLRVLQAGWKLLFFKSGPLVHQASHDAEWNRGAYMAEALAHCSACHSPRNALGAEDSTKAYSGGILDGRTVPALTQANYSPVPWSQDELFTYLRTGDSKYHGDAGGPMGGIVRDGLSKLPDADIHALSIYFADIGETASRSTEIAFAIKRADKASPLDLVSQDPRARLYLTACASCHYNSSASSSEKRPNLATLSALNAPDPTDLVRIVVFGHRADMPAFGKGLRDKDISDILAYLRATRTASPPWIDLDAKIAQLRAQGSK